MKSPQIDTKIIAKITGFIKVNDINRRRKSIGKQYEGEYTTIIYNKYILVNETKIMIEISKSNRTHRTFFGF